ncbi:MAG: hypothetical protein ACRC7N_04820 [Clostridium sp.]
MKNINSNENKGKLWNRIGGSSSILYSIIVFFIVLFTGKIILSYINIESISPMLLDSILLIVDLVITYIFYIFINRAK